MVEEDTRPVKIVCEECGSEDIEAKVYQTWDVVHQRWEGSVDDYYCNGECNGECNVKEVPLDVKELAQIAIHNAGKGETPCLMHLRSKARSALNPSLFCY